MPYFEMIDVVEIRRVLARSKKARGDFESRAEKIANILIFFPREYHRH